MKPISEPVKREDTTDVLVKINARERDALNSAVNFYLQNHKKGEDDNLYARLEQLDLDLDVLLKILKPAVPK